MENTRQSKLFTWLIVIIGVFTPFTQLRVFKFGVSELLILVAVMLYFIVYGNKLLITTNTIFSKFWLIYIPITILSFALNVIFFRENYIRVNMMFFDLFTYLFVLVFVLLTENLLINKTILASEIISKIFKILSVVFVILFIIGRFVNGVGSLQIFYYSFFSPFATNIHHTSMVLGPVTFSVFVAMRSKSIRIKVIYVLLFMAMVFLLSMTGSTKSIMIIYFGLFLTILVAFWQRIKKVNFLPLFAMLALMIIIVCLYVIFHEEVNNTIADFFVTNDGGGARQKLYGFSINKGLNAFLIGYGPGPHSEYVPQFLSDSHQTILSSFLQAGIIGAILFITLFVKVIIKTINRNYILLPMLGGVAIYILGGDVLRRIPIWLFLMLIYHYQNKESIIT